MEREVSFTSCTENEYLDSMELEEIKKNLAYQELVEKDGCTCSYGGFKRIVVWAIALKPFYKEKRNENWNHISEQIVRGRKTRWMWNMCLPILKQMDESSWRCIRKKSNNYIKTCLEMKCPNSIVNPYRANCCQSLPHILFNALFVTWVSANCIEKIDMSSPSTNLPFFWEFWNGSTENRGTFISPAGTGLGETYSFIYSNGQLKA